MWDYCGARDGQPALHLDLVIVDEKGDVMYAEAGGRDVDKVRSAVKEGDVYSFSKFLVVNMKPSYKPFCVKYMIKLTLWTKMDRVESVVESFSRFVFYLSLHSDLSSRVGSQVYFIGYGLKINFVLRGNHANEFDAKAVHLLGQEHAVGIFVGTLVKFGSHFM
ncbi:hypothetical protein SETIT_3G165600v2 [Setaria italica]|uniref:Replication protein A 70 kDa DNA-binding subunit B/D first OB fold domain-containing protein n=1 Tax=Setaria italica TaxID=4555 RepID=A0A368QG56_SETIT|nr:hypothetical protein SETIT_3G165600v2 [Setaria italica]